MNLEFKEKWELLALHKVFMEAKYHESPDNFDVQGSPIVEDLYERVFQLLLSTCSDKEQESWKNWRNLDSHEHRIPNLKSRLKAIHSSNWPKDLEDKIDYVKSLVSPLIASDEKISELVSYGNSVHDNH